MLKTHACATFLMREIISSTPPFIAFGTPQTGGGSHLQTCSVGLYSGEYVGKIPAIAPGTCRQILFQFRAKFDLSYTGPSGRITAFQSRHSCFSKIGYPVPDCQNSPIQNLGNPRDFPAFCAMQYGQAALPQIP